MIRTEQKRNTVFVGISVRWKTSPKINAKAPSGWWGKISYFFGMTRLKSKSVSNAVKGDDTKL
jgi:hypothetical protein